MVNPGEFQWYWVASNRSSSVYRQLYGRENLVETYYTAHVYRGLYLGPDLQCIVNPGYNQARGPVLVPSFRTHVEF